MASSKKVKKSVKKAVKKTNGRLILYVLCFIIFAVGTYFACSFLFKNDTFALNATSSGETQTISITINDSYSEPGATLISYGKDKSAEVTVKYYYRTTEFDAYAEVDGVDTSVPGIYYAKYANANSKFKSIELVRTIIVSDVGGEV